ncbi:terminase small subunit, partial [Staphylococcus aureus]|nr:terminase small subunit [Staphylococcus aureus]
NAAVGDETETKEVVVKRGEYKENPQSGKVQLVYNEHVELIEVPIKPSDRLKARDMLGKYHKLFADKHNVPIFINIGEWDGDDDKLDKTVKEVSNANPNHPVIVDDIPLED